jgi:hypothetical protein
LPMPPPFRPLPSTDPVRIRAVGINAHLALRRSNDVLVRNPYDYTAATRLGQGLAGIWADYKASNVDMG